MEEEEEEDAAAFDRETAEVLAMLGLRTGARMGG
jgi:hypothetical protein